MDTLANILQRLPQLFAPLDFAALGLFVLVSLLISRVIEHPPAARPSVSRLMDEHRLAWMRTFAAREARIFDANLLTTLRAGSAFFASTALLAVGGVAALVGQTEQMLGVVRDLGAQQGAAAVPVWEAKLLFITLLLINAFLKFVWSHRLFGYLAVLMGAMGEPGEPAAIERAAKIQSAAGRNFNRGLRSVYFTLAASAWFLGPISLMVATVLTALMLIRREFFSESRRALTEAPPEQGAPN